MYVTMQPQQGNAECLAPGKKSIKRLSLDNLSTRAVTRLLLILNLIVHYTYGM